MNQFSLYSLNTNCFLDSPHASKSFLIETSQLSSRSQHEEQDWKKGTRRAFSKEKAEKQKSKAKAKEKPLASPNLSKPRRRHLATQSQQKEKSRKQKAKSGEKQQEGKKQKQNAAAEGPREESREAKYKTAQSSPALRQLAQIKPSAWATHKYTAATRRFPRSGRHSGHASRHPTAD
ncbi:uncharacterized protein BKA78DRAFT_12345 [Phyllosticta capitalensis]|uniref:uncharacterized protein n=1 Tax=Phyllosticta capitalensis TaxID=121624 RepID=UPI0031309588